MLQTVSNCDMLDAPPNPIARQTQHNRKATNYAKQAKPPKTHEITAKWKSKKSAKKYKVVQ